MKKKSTVLMGLALLIASMVIGLSGCPNVNDDGGEDTYTVTFHSQGGSAVESQSIVSGGTVTQPANPTKRTDAFGGWYKEAAATTAWNFATDTVTQDTTLYAKWTPDSWTGGDVAGTTWYWGDVVLKFIDADKAAINTLGIGAAANGAPATSGYDYTFDSGTQSGTISGDVNRRSGSTGQIYHQLGAFSITDGVLTFNNYRQSGYTVSFTPAPNPQSGLVGIIWYGPNFVIECIDGANAILYAPDGYYTTITKLTYTYNTGTKTGNFAYISGPLNGSPNSFTIRENYTFSSYFEDFAWRGGNKNNLTVACNLHCPIWKSYGHGWDFVKLDANGIERGTP
ncbi:hypothetical protein AGMMS4952_17150 [Spirochaetia bacterium]|nr:hypothetical protein AGMMS4952_17150 [Spirochaetia bacterium]